METETKSNGALIGLVVILIILVAGGLYIWQSNKEILQRSTIKPNPVTIEDSTQLDTLGTDIENADTSTGVDASTLN